MQNEFEVCLEEISLDSNLLEGPPRKSRSHISLNDINFELLIR